jgi:predicted Zn-dependent protease
VATAAAHDRTTGAQAGAASTGHAIWAGGEPLPINVTMEPGQATEAEMVAALGDGLVVNRFHYTNVVHPLDTVLTAMTRDGVFRVEGGEVKEAVADMRYTQNVLEAFGHVRAVGRETVTNSEYGEGAYRGPALVVDSWRFHEPPEQEPRG